MADAHDGNNNYGCLLFWISSVSIVLIILLAFHHPPQTVILHVPHASLIEFSPTAAACSAANVSTLNYNLTLDIALRNPNLYYSVHHDSVEVMTYYRNQTQGFGTMVNLKSFEQEYVNTALLTPSFRLQRPANSQLAVVDEDVIVVKLYFRNLYFIKEWHLIEWKARSEFACELKVPSISNITNGQSIITRTGFDTFDSCMMIDHSFTFPVALRICFCLLIFCLFVVFFKFYIQAAALVLIIVTWLLFTV